MRRPLIVANWKMHKTAHEASTWVQQFAKTFTSNTVDVVVAPPFTVLHGVAQALAGTSFHLAAQNLFWEDQGAYTGEVSGVMLKDAGCAYVLVGHSERRRLFGEDNQVVAKKVRAALRHGLRPLLCIGETLAEREEGLTEQVIAAQLQEGLRGASKEDMNLITIAYEPVWAIGTGRAATPGQAESVHHLIRDLIRETWGADTSEGLRILYGGSVNPDNTAAFVSSAEVDGVLVGGSCLDPFCFAKIARSSEPTSVQEG